MIKNSLILLSVFILTACVSSPKLDELQGSGKTVVYEASYNQIHKASLCSLRGRGFRPYEKEKGKILSRLSSCAFGPGDRVAIFLTPITPDTTKVEVVSSHSNALKVFAKNWTSEIVAGIDQCLEN